MDKSVNELAEKFTLLMIEGGVLQEQYEKGKVTFASIMEHIASMRKAREELENLMTVQVARFYGRCKVLRDKRGSEQREAESKKNISELGF